MDEEKSVKGNLGWEDWDWRRVIIHVVLSSIVLLLIALVLLCILAVFMHLCDCCVSCGEEYALIRFWGVALSVAIATLGIGAVNRGAYALDNTAKAQDREAKATETGNLQQRFRDAVTQLGHEKASVRQGAANTMFYLALEEDSLRAPSAETLCAHIRVTTEEDQYTGKHKDKPSIEVQSILNLLFIPTQN